MTEAMSFKIPWKTWNAKLAELNRLPEHMKVMTKSLTIFGVETLRKRTPRSNKPGAIWGGQHLADTWGFEIRGDSPIMIRIFNTQVEKEYILRILEYGSKPHEIVPVNAMALRFVWRGRLIYTKHVEHQGTKAVEMIQSTKSDMMLRVSYLKQELIRRFGENVRRAG